MVAPEPRGTGRCCSSALLGAPPDGSAGVRSEGPFTVAMAVAREEWVDEAIVDHSEQSPVSVTRRAHPRVPVRAAVVACRAVGRHGITFGVKAREAAAWTEAPG